MLMAEIILLACLFAFLIYLLVRVESQQRQIQNLREQLAYHIQRSHSSAAVASAPPKASPAPALRRPGRAPLRLVKE